MYESPRDCYTECKKSKSCSRLYFYRFIISCYKFLPLRVIVQMNEIDVLGSFLCPTKSTFIFTTVITQ